MNHDRGASHAEGDTTLRLHDIDVPEQELEHLCRRWQVTSLSVFGSALRADFSRDSDIDLLISFAPHAPWSLIDLVAIRDDFAALFGRPVDLLERSTVENSHNWMRRAAILESARQVYAAG